MPWSYSIDPERGIIVATGTGVLTGDELMVGLANETRDPHFRSDMRYFIDYHAVTDVRVPASTMMQAAAHPAFSTGMRRAFYVSSGFFESALKFAKLSANGPYEVFTDRASAVAWLNEGVPPEKRIT